MNTAAQPSIDVVIPAYNAIHGIGKALDSVRAQSLQPRCVVVVNDGSTDDTEGFVERYRSKHREMRITLISQSNKGIAGARNAGMQACDGDYVAFLDADDIWYPDKLASVAMVFAGHPNVDVVHHAEVEQDLNGYRQELRTGQVVNPAYMDLLFNRNRLSTSATTVRRSLLHEVGGFLENIDFNSAEDYDLWLRLARSGASFHYLDVLLGEYLRDDSSITTRIEYHTNNVLNVFSAHLAQLCDDGRIAIIMARRMKACRVFRIQLTRLKWALDNRRAIAAAKYTLGTFLASFRLLSTGGMHSCRDLISGGLPLKDVLK